MQDTDIALSPILGMFGKEGWSVDYERLTASARLESQLKHTEIFASMTFKPERQEAALTYGTHVRRRINIRGIKFLEIVRDSLKPEVCVSWEEPNRIDVEWILVSNNLSDDQCDPRALLCEIEEMWDKAHIFQISCVRILDLCARVVDRGGTVEYARLTPSNLAALCLCHVIRGEQVYDA